MEDRDGLVLAEAVGRPGWAVEDAQRDVDVLWWVGRFRFVTAAAMAVRFGVSVQQARARVRRLQSIGLLGAWRRSPSEPLLVYLTGRGATLLGLPRRGAPRLDTQQVHELAIVELATRLEREGVSVWTERECRRLEHAGKARFSVRVPANRRGDTTRWPDLVVQDAGGLGAVEIELSPKTTERLKAIVMGYGRSRYDHVTFHVSTPAFAGRIREAAKASSWRTVPEFRVGVSGSR